MADQPANTTISIRRALRGSRLIRRSDSVAVNTKGLRPLTVPIPGQEVLTQVLTRDTAVKDFSPYMGEARYTATRGFPIVIGQAKAVSFANAQTHIADADFGFKIGKDQFLPHAADGLANDLYGEAQALTPDVA